VTGRECGSKCHTGRPEWRSGSQRTWLVDFAHSPRGNCCKSPHSQGFWETYRTGFSPGGEWQEVFLPCFSWIFWYESRPLRGSGGDWHHSCWGGIEHEEASNVAAVCVVQAANGRDGAPERSDRHARDLPEMQPDAAEHGGAAGAACECVPTHARRVEPAALARGGCGKVNGAILSPGGAGPGLGVHVARNVNHTTTSIRLPACPPWQQHQLR
jgi:hypothetical protein